MDAENRKSGKYRRISSKICHKAFLGKRDSSLLKMKSHILSKGKIDLLFFLSPNQYYGI